MLGRNKHQSEAGKSIMKSSMIGLANTLAVVTTFLGVPPLFSKTINFVHAYAENHYGAGWDDLVSLSWFLICVCTMFFVSRMTVTAALVMGGMAILSRMF